MMLDQTSHGIVITGCACGTGLSVMQGYIALAVLLIIIQAVVIAIDLIFMWRRCKEKVRRVDRMKKLKGANKNGSES